MPTLERLIRLTALSALAVATTAGAVGAASQNTTHHAYVVRHAYHPHAAVHHQAEHATCTGENMYWHDGNCLDARDKDSSTWMQGVFKPK